MKNCIFKHFTLHLRFTTLKLFSLIIAQYPAQKAQNFKPATDLKFTVSTPPKQSLGVYKNHLVRPSVCLSVRLSVQSD